MRIITHSRIKGDAPESHVMTHQDHLSRIIKKITEVLGSPCLIKPHVLEFIQTTVSAASSVELKTILESNTDFETDSIIDLIFYPDQDILEEIEPLLEQVIFTRDNEAKIIESLLAKPITARIFLPEFDIPATIDIPDFVIEQFVARLNIKWRLKKEISDIINQRFSIENQLKIKVKIRNTGPVLRTADARLLYGFLGHIDPVHRDLFPCLDLILTFLDEMKDDPDPYDFLVEKKRFYVQSLKKAEKFEQLFMKTNMETLMLMGVKPPHTPKIDLKRKMKLIDTVCRAVFNKTEYFQTVFENHYHDQLCPESEMEKIMSLLS